MENRRIINHKLILGGALLGALLVLANASPIFAYSQHTTHPALTSNIVDFYNLSFTNKTITQEEKQWLIKGSIDEDDGGRFFSHFYDPVYGRGLQSVFTAGVPTISSKKWAMGDTQKNFYNSQLTGYAAISGADSNHDFSYDRALRDYAKGDKQRAFIAFGHVLHLLEDAGVPDHTRNDPHPPVLDLGSPYEHEMDKWNPENFQIARKLFLTREKPVVLSDIGSYLDRVANYSNNNFFSKDTINNEVYSKPSTTELARLFINGGPRLFIVGKDKNNQIFPLALVRADKDKELKPFLVSKEVGSYILDGYWDRLSKEVVVSGAGALRLFLEEAEAARREYLAKAEQKKPSFWAQILGVLGITIGNQNKLATSEGQRTSDVADDVGTTSGVKDELSTRPTYDVGNPQSGDSGDRTGDTSGDRKVSPSVSPLSSSLSPLPLVSPKVSPLVSPTPKTSPSLSPTPKPNSNIKTTGKVVINEVAWAGTEASATDEWLELYNAENYDIDLSGWTLKAEDGTPEITIYGLTTSGGQGTPEVNGGTSDVNDDSMTPGVNNSIIKARGYFLLERTDDTTVNTIVADQIYIGALGNTGQVLRLTDLTGSLVDTVGKTGEKWFAGSSTPKISMERISASISGDITSSWKNFTGDPSAKDANGNFINGTPKAQNSPGVIMMTGGGGGGSTLQQGSGQASSPQATPTPTPLVSPTPTPDSTSSPQATPTPSPEPEGDSDSGDTANSGDVVINEIAWMGTTLSANDEWVELRNMTNSAVNLTGWKLSAQDGTPDLTLSGSIGPLGFFLLERTDDETLPEIEADQIYTGALGNSGEHLILKDIASTTINQVDGSNNWEINGDDIQIGDNTTKKTAQRMDNGWITATATPKAQNSADVATTQTPSTVTDLAATHGSPTITATWTAPDPGTYQPASLSYDLRYSSTIFTEVASASWWSGATMVASSSLPSVASEGASQSASFDVIPEYDLTLYFALRTKVIHISTCDVDCPQAGISNVASVSFPSAINNGAWGMFGKDQYHTSFATVTGPGTSATISWEFNADAGNSVSQPVADADGNIYFGAANNSSSKIIKLDKNKVKQWEYSINVSIGTPAVLSDGIVYFGRVGAGGVLAFTALNSDGTKKWDYSNASKVEKITVNSKGEPYFTYTSGTDKLAVLNTDSTIKTPFPISASGLAGFAPVVLDNGTIISAKYVSGHQFFNAHLVDGKLLWELSHTGAYNNAPVNPSYDKISGKTYSAAGPKLFAIPENPQNGLIPSSNIHTITPFNYIAATTVAISADTLYVGFNNTNVASGSLLYALNKSDLSKKWFAPFQADGLLNKQLVIDNAGNVYFSTKNGKLYGVDSTGAQLWVINSGLNSTISPVLTEHGLVWGYGGKIVVIK